MTFRRPRRPGASIELTPLIDVVFLLLIFFMVSAVLVRETRLEVTLPEAAADAPAGAAPRLTIAATGAYALNDEPLKDRRPETLAAALRPAVAEQGRLVIAADAQARHGAVVTALDVAAEVGARQVRIAALAPTR